MGQKSLNNTSFGPRMLGFTITITCFWLIWSLKYVNWLLFGCFLLLHPWLCQIIYGCIVTIFFCFYLMCETPFVPPPISTLPHYTIYRLAIWVAVYFSILTRLFKIVFWQFGDIWTILILLNFDCLRIIICHRATSLEVEWWLDRYLVLCHSINPFSF